MADLLFKTLLAKDFYDDDLKSRDHSGILVYGGAVETDY